MKEVKVVYYKDGSAALFDEDGMQCTWDKRDTELGWYIGRQLSARYGKQFELTEVQSEQKNYRQASQQPPAPKEPDKNDKGNK